MAAGSAVSELRTVQQVVQGYLAGDLTASYASTIVRASDSAMGPIADTFASTDPPVRGQDALRTKVLDELSVAQDAVATARTALARDDHAGLRSAVALLESASAALEQEEEALQ